MPAIDLVRARPLPGLIKSQPAHTLDVPFGVSGEDYCIYLVDERELHSARDLPADYAVPRGPGEPISGQITLDLPGGSYDVACYDPKTGQYSVSVRTQGDPNTQLTLPTFVHDLVVRIR